ncbi:hypothetical protein WV31_10400 [Magnetospirillum sp. ME-1]|nr:hypothetical protein WV31_10400 [Magnetospirillum sp. ME-1]
MEAAMGDAMKGIGLGTGEGKEDYGFLHALRTALKASKGSVKRKNPPRTYSDILGEMARRPGFFPHVDAPAAPIHVFGMTADELEKELDAWYATPIEIEGQGFAKGKRHLRRPDSTMTRLFSAVVSYPVPIAAMTAADSELAGIYFGLADGFMGRLLGEDLRSVYEHRDEEYLHRHYQGFSKDPSVELHPCYRAKRAASGRGIPGRIGNQAFVRAGKELQYAFWLEVSAPCGFAHRDNTKVSRRLPLAAVRQIKRYRQMAADALAVGVPATVENASLRERVEALMQQAARQSAARSAVETELAASRDSVQALSARVEEIERTGAEAVSRWENEKRLREDAEAKWDGERANRRDVARRALEEKASREAAEDQLETARAARESDRAAAAMLQDRIEALEAMLADRDGTIAWLRRFAPSGGSDGADGGPAPAASDALLDVQRPESGRYIRPAARNILEAGSSYPPLPPRNRRRGDEGGGEAVSR